MNFRIILGAVLLATAVLGASGCAPQEPAASREMAAPSPAAAGQSEAQAAASAPAPAQPAESVALPQDEGELQNSDCIKCHDREPADIEANGGRHKTSVTCIECHLEHLPLGTQTTPECSMCHGGGAHFELDNCLGCHSNPHTPLLLTIADTPESTTGCLTCHEGKGEELLKNPSKHAEQNCTLCHPDRHKVIYKCGECHEPHADFMAYEDCLRCHRPHSPLNITYAEDVPSALCGSCHTELFESLSANPSKHRELNCAFCHQQRHPTVPTCQDCHEAPHAPDLLARFPDCLGCHKDPHDLAI